VEARAGRERVSEKMNCPVCGSYSSSVLRAVEDGEPCPNCGAPAATILEVNHLRERRSDEQLKARVEALLIENGKLKQERDRLLLILDRVQLALRTWESE
jgi:hypothetical protein